MKASFAVADGFSGAIDLVASTVATWVGRLDSPRSVKLVEEECGRFVLQADQPNVGLSPIFLTSNVNAGQVIDAARDGAATGFSGARVELFLHPDRFLFRSIEFPGRAAEFLDGIVRSQIDRLTPWSAAEAAFGWSKSAAAGTDRIVVTIAAAELALVMPYIRAISHMGPHSVAVFTSMPDSSSGASPIKICEERAQDVSEIARIRRALIMLFVAGGIAAGTTIGAFTIVNAHVQSKQDDVARRMADLRPASGATSGTVAAALREVERRKRESPSTVIVLETLSRILPGHTYVTELRVEGNKLRLVGITRDAPSLIELIEQSSRFTRATFFGPTIRSPSEPGERFHIEAIIQPLGAPLS